MIKLSYNNLPLLHCSWLSQSAFNTTMPLEVNKKYIKYINESGTFKMLPQHIRQKNLCLCYANNHYDCNKELLDPIYPGQTMTLQIYTNSGEYTWSDTVVMVANDINWQPTTSCIITNSSEMVQISKSQTCTNMQYTIAFPKQKWCELLLRGLRDRIDKIDIYYVTELPCPSGFIKTSSGVCQCYPFLEKFGIRCNINDQTILRPANAWISPILQKNSYSYDLSLHCPFHYCLPHSSHLNFSTPNLQCKFNRSGVLCGSCQQGLSTVFGSSHCQQCTNIYLLLIIPIEIAGLVMILLLFILNLTVTDGTINAFILYVNIISINTPVFFRESRSFNLAYTFISLANLDLGIETCFYNGMDDYAKMWLQLAFPFYLIFIAISLIITSRYSTTIQRITARRALPVLATLFLLSYTKILLIISSVLFHYSKIIHLPGEHTELVWSVDANIPLLGIRFALLFIVSSIMFLILLPFNVILLFTRTLSKFKFITKFKPLLDAYQGPYKIKFYYWTGVQLVTRVVFYGLASLDRNINLTLSTLLLTIIVGLEGILRPFKSKYKNYQELLFVFNLQSLFVILLYNDDNTYFIHTMIILAMFHLSTIVVYHFSYYACGGMIRRKVELTVDMLKRLFASTFNRQKVLQIKTHDVELHNIPEITYNYHDYQEPLIGLD